MLGMAGTRHGGRRVRPNPWQLPSASKTLSATVWSNHDTTLTLSAKEAFRGDGWPGSRDDPDRGPAGRSFRSAPLDL